MIAYLNGGGRARKRRGKRHLAQLFLGDFECGIGRITGGALHVHLGF